MEVTYRNLTDSDYPEWSYFTEQAYGENHILTDWPHLKWFMGGAPDCRPNGYETIVAVLPDGKIAGTYGVMPALLRVHNKVYTLCWYISGMVLPELRNQGIGKNFVDILLDRFDVNGVIGFNLGVKRNYQRFGFNFFGDRTLRRFVKLLHPEAYELTAQIGFDATQAQELVPLSTDAFQIRSEATPVLAFDKSVDECVQVMASRVKVTILRTAPYLNWRYFMNPRLVYECTGIKHKGNLSAYLVARHERFYPTEIYGTRIIDAAGLPEDAVKLFESKIAEAEARHDALVEFMFIGDFYEGLMETLGFTELVGPAYEWWPLVTTPIERRQNEEFICLGSRKYPSLFDDIEFNDLYFTRGDSDRDRANRPK